MVCRGGPRLERYVPPMRIAGRSSADCGAELSRAQITDAPTSQGAHLRKDWRAAGDRRILGLQQQQRTAGGVSLRRAQGV